MFNLKSIPFLKILLPYLVGIIAFFYFGLFQKLHVVFLSALALWVLAFVFQKFYKPKDYFKKGIYIFLTNLLLFLLAFEACYLYSDKNKTSHYSNHVSYQSQSFIATVTDIPVTSEKFIKIPVQINCIQENMQWHYADGNSIVYLKNDSTIKLNLGNNLLLNTTFCHVNEPKNPNEFDYKSFLDRKSVV